VGVVTLRAVLFVIELRSYQSRGIADIREAYRIGMEAPLYVAPTGSGKTALFSAVAHGAAAKGNRVLILTHRIELVDQISSALTRSDTPHEFVAAGYPQKDAQCLVASVQTLVRRLTSIKPPNLIIIDEAHHCIQGNTWSRIMQAYPKAKRLGVTATPIRADSRGLGAHFDLLIRGPSEQELIDGGYLARVRIFAPKLVDTSGLRVRMGDYAVGESEALLDKPAITGSAFSHYMQHTPHEQGLVFCTSVKHAENVAAQFRDGGVPALSLNGGTDKTLRRMVNADFRDGKIRILASCDLFSEGYDVPAARVGIMLRPTQSLGLYRQQRGRIMRPALDKPYATLLDCVRNCERPGFELLPGEVDDWELTDDAARKKKKPPPGVKVCPKCFASSNPQAAKCSNKGPPPCGHVFVVKSREIDNREGEIHEITPEEIARRRARQEQGRSQTLEALMKIEQTKQYRPGWAKHVFEARQAKKQKVGT
jgi:superfamily II DNA or RNA helicase